jgi:beta-catenin-like protein 1
MKSEALSSTAVPPSPAVSKPKPPPRVTVEDAEDDDDEDEAGPSASASARHGAEDEEPELSEEDEDGRFFGGGLTSQQRDILNIFDGAGGEGAVQDVRSTPPNARVL